MSVYVSVGRVGRGSGGKSYYLGLAREDGMAADGDYYLDGGPSGRWFGRLAAEMGLVGPVDPSDFRSLHDGHSPGGEPLSRNARHPGRRPAFDLTHGLVKDASIIASASDEWLRRIIEEVGSSAVGASLDYLERECCWSRRGRGGTEPIRGGGFLGAAFDHVAARSVGGVADAQLHRHCVVFNSTRGEDGRLRTLDADHLYRNARTAAALASVEESYHLERLGFRIERAGRSFQVVGIPDALREEHSRRSAQIRGVAGEGATPRQRDRANLATREPKGRAAPAAQGADWRQRNELHGLTPGRLVDLSRHAPRGRDVAGELRAATGRALSEICTSRSTFASRDLVEQVAIECQGRGVRAIEVRLHVGSELERSQGGLSRDVVCMGLGPDGDERWTTRELHELELGILRAAARTKDRPGWVGRAATEAAIAGRPTLLAEQERAVRHIVSAPGAIKCVVGGAGTGKTFMLDCAREAIERGGGHVIGTSLSSRATRNLAAQGRLRECYNVRKLLYELDRGRIRIGRRTFVIMDEAGMTGTRDFSRIVAEVARRDATLVCVGDHLQHQSIEAGGAFFGLSRRDASTVELAQIIRQRGDEDRRMVAAFRDRRIHDALGILASQGRLLVGEDLPSAQGLLVGRWGSDGMRQDEKLIIASTNEQVDSINRLCQRWGQGVCPRPGEGVEVRGGRAFVGDRILCRRNAPSYDVCNGDLATVIGADPARDELRVRLDHGGRAVTISLPEYGREQVSLGFALTSHKAQGASVENAYLFIHGRMTDAQTAYVMGSRHRNACFLATTRDDAGEDLERLIREMGRTRIKLLAHDAAGLPGPAGAGGPAWCLERVR